MSPRIMSRVVASALLGLLPAAAVAQRSMTAGPPVGIIRENFNAMGTSATATFPTGFRATGDVTPNWTTGTNTTATTQAAGTAGTGVVSGSSAGGVYNWANGVTGTSGDRALGSLTSGAFASPRTVMFAFTNDTGARITTLNVDYSWEKYRSGSRAHDCNFFHSADGGTWTAAAAGNRSFVADANNTTVFNPPQAYRHTVTLTNLDIAPGATYYLRWTITGVGGSTNAQGLGIDDIEISAGGILADDSASNGAYSGGWTNGSNGGTGWSGGWSLDPTTNGPQRGFFIGNSATNGSGDSNLDGDINTPNTSSPFNQTQAFGYYANSGQTSSAVRTMAAPMKVGDQFRLRLDNGFLDPTAVVGFGLRNSAGENLLEFYFADGTPNYQVNRDGGAVQISGFGYTDQGVEVVITLTGTNTYHLQAIRLLDGLVASNTGSLMNPSGGQAICQLRAFNFTAGVGSARDAFINLPRIVDPILPSVTSIVRQTPSGTDTNAATVVFRVTFSEPVSGVDTADFALDVTGLTGSAVSAVTPVSSFVYDVSVATGSGVGTLSIDVPLAATITDVATNGLAAAFTAGQTYNVDRVAPTVTSVNRQTPSGALTNASSVTYQVTFSEDVSGVDAADFTLNASGVTGATVGTVTPVSASVYDVQVNTGTGDGTLRLDVPGTATITDTFSNAFTTAFTSGQTYTLDRTAPTVTSVNRQTPSGALTNASSVTYRVTFSENVSGVDAADFTLNASGVTGATVGTVTPVSASVYDVHVNTGTGDGTLRLDVPGTATITDEATNAFTTAFTSGQTYTLDRTAPTVSMGSADDTQAGGTVDGTYSASDANGVASTTLYFREPGGAWTAGGALSGGTFAHTPTVSGPAADGRYFFATVATDNAGNTTTIPAGADVGDTSILFNDIANSAFSHVYTANGTSTFPMTDSIDILIALTGVSSPTTVTVSRVTGNVSAAGLDAARLIDEALSITGALAGATATITWNFDPASDDTLVGPIDTVFQVEGGVVVNSYPVTPVGTTITIPGVTAFSDWYAGNAVTAVPDWTLLED